MKSGLFLIALLTPLIASAAGGNSGGGGDEVAIGFRQALAKANEILTLRHLPFRVADVSKTKILVTNEKISFEPGPDWQKGVAETEDGVVRIQRQSWLDTTNEVDQQAIAVHQMLKLTHQESVGDFHLTQTFVKSARGTCVTDHCLAESTENAAVQIVRLLRVAKVPSRKTDSGESMTVDGVDCTLSVDPSPTIGMKGSDDWIYTNDCTIKSANRSYLLHGRAAEILHGILEDQNNSSSGDGHAEESTVGGFECSIAKGRAPTCTSESHGRTSYATEYGNVSVQKEIRQALRDLRTDLTDAYGGFKDQKIVPKVLALLPRIHFVVTDKPLVVHSNETWQVGVAENYPRTLTIKVNRQRWIKVAEENLRAAVILHEVLSLLKVESTGIYTHSQEYYTYISTLRCRDDVDFCPSARGERTKTDSMPTYRALAAAVGTSAEIDLRSAQCSLDRRSLEYSCRLVPRAGKSVITRDQKIAQDLYHDLGPGFVKNLNCTLSASKAVCESDFDFSASY